MADLSNLSLDDLYTLRNQMLATPGVSPSLRRNPADQAQLPAVQSVIKQQETQNPAYWGGTVSPFGIDTGIRTPPVVDQLLSGAGKASYDLGTGYLQTRGELGLGPKVFSREAIDLKKRLDAPLMTTTAGKVGNFIGNVTDLAPIAAIPGLNTFLGSATSGGVLGALEPVGTGDSRLANAGTSAMFSATTPAAITAARTAKAFLEPTYQGGRNAIIGRTINRFVGNDPQALARLQNPQILVPNSLPTAADASGNAGLAMLENGVSTHAPEAKVAFDQRLKANAAARQDALQSVAGDQSQMDFYKASRDATAQQLYDTAFAEVPGSTPWIRGQITQLTQRPAFVQALKDGQEMAMNLGIKVDPKSPENTTQILHFTKQALDDRIASATQQGNGNAARALIDTRDKLVSLLESKDFSPSYREARDTYKQMSVPINQMEIGQALYNKMVPALNDFGGTARAKAQTFADAVRNADATATQTLGFPGAKMDQIMSPDQMRAITGVARDLSRRAATEDMMRGIGSNTAQNLAAQNIAGQIAGPLGLPQSWTQSIMSGLLSVPYVGAIAKAGMGPAENALQRDLAAALLSPQETAKLAAKAQPRQLPAAVLNAARYLPAVRFGLLEGIIPQGRQQ